MANQTQQIRIESILGGHAPTTHFSAQDQFLSSLGINPSLPSSDAGRIASGLIRPSACEKTGSTNDAVMWLANTPKNSNIYAYDYSGSVYTISNSNGSVTGLADLNDSGSSKGNGMAYYDNYVYFARDTTVARYGPLDGTPTWTKDYWVTTLGKVALEDTDYPFPYSTYPQFPNHVLHRHSNGVLYIADIVGNTGAIHYIKTSKTTVEGDTDAGSTYDKLNVGYGLWPIAMESYGEQLVIAFIEMNTGISTNNVSRPKGKIAFWDTTSEKVNQITWAEFPDGIISALRNINGVLYAISGPNFSPGFRVSRYVGGFSFEEVYYSEVGNPPYHGAVDGDSNRLLFGGKTEVPEEAACVWSLGTSKRALGSGLFNVFRSTASGGNEAVTALGLLNNGGQGNGFTYNEPLVAHVSSTSTGIEVANSYPGDGFVYNNAPSVWQSQTYRIGKPFKITKIRIPIARPLTADVIVTPKVYFDSGAGSDTLTAITPANYGTNTQSIVIRPENLTADNDFYLELRFTGEDLCVVSLPITIEYELLDVETAFP